MSEILLSVAITTYNHEAFIAQCLDNVLNQKVDFRYEIVIGEDCSTDKTREICRQYKERFPDKIVLLENVENLGLRKNNFQVWSSCKGKYIAYLEGDDFWTNEDKLQKQIDFLENNKQYIGSGHQTYLWYGSDLQRNKLFSLIEDGHVVDFEQNIDQWLFATCSFVFRNFFTEPQLKKLKENFSTNILFWSDRPLMILLSLYGDFYYHGENMGCWRQHENNMTRKGNLAQMNIEGGKAYSLIAKLYPQHRKKVKELTLRWYLLAANEFFKSKRRMQFIQCNFSAFINISSFLGLKNYVKSTIYILRGKPIYE